MAKQSIQAQLQKELKSYFNKSLKQCLVGADNILTLVVSHDEAFGVCKGLHDEFAFEQLTDLSGVDYGTYGEAEWKTQAATSTGFSRSVCRELALKAPEGHRFAVVYHLLSLKHDIRLRIRAFIPGEMPRLPSVTKIWAVADWYEREAFDLYGIVFDGHSDLRRILTDYGFVGHPFRKDFPLSGHVEMRYDASKDRVVYEPVEIEPRVLVPRVIRHDNRYGEEEAKS